MDEDNKPTPEVPNHANETPTEPSSLKNASILNPTKPKFPLTLIIGIILFLLIAGSAAGFYVYKQSLKTAKKITPQPIVQKQIPSPTPDPTTNWKTISYTNEGFSFKYPEKEFVGEFPEKCFENNTYGDFWFRTYLNNPGFSKKDWINSADYKNCSLSGEDGSQFEITIGKNIYIPKSPPYHNKSIIVGNQNALLFYESESRGGEGGNIIGFSRNEKYYRIHIPFEKSFNNGRMDPLIDQILSTFKFTNAQAVDISNWKTYTSTLKEYKFLFPPQWNAIEAQAVDPNPDTRGSEVTTLVKFASKAEMQKVTILRNGNSWGKFQVKVFPNAQHLTLDEIVANDLKPAPTELPSNSTKIIGDLSIDGIASKKYASFGGDQSIIDFVFIHNDKIYYVQYGDAPGNDPNYKDNQAIYSQILSTFKFTDDNIPHTGQYSKLGESCGENAGQAGNAQCETGLNCKYKTQDDFKNKIGVCETQ